MTAIDWAARAAAHAEMDGDEWDAEEGRFREDWKAAYREAFIRIAVSRGWKREDAETWPEHLDDESYIEAYRLEWCPERVAETDVIACEEPL
jgi:hypothetical protein